MWKKIGLIFLGLMIGCILGYAFCMTYYGSVISKGMFVLQEGAIINQGEFVEDAYYNEPNEIAIWALTNYIKTLNNLKKERSPAKVKNPYFLLNPDMDLFIAHARLGKIYKQVGKSEESQFHFKQALTFRKCPEATEDYCIKFLDEMDKSHLNSK